MIISAWARGEGGATSSGWSSKQARGKIVRDVETGGFRTVLETNVDERYSNRNNSSKNETETNANTTAESETPSPDSSEREPIPAPAAGAMRNYHEFLPKYLTDAYDFLL